MEDIYIVILHGLLRSVNTYYNYSLNNIIEDGIMIERDDLIRETIINAAKFMAISAITAPKARGIDNIVVKILDKREELIKLADKMEELASLYGEFFLRDADNVRNSDAVLLIGCKIVDIGVHKPGEMKYDPNLVLSVLNLGIAIGSAVKTASILNIDNRIMYRAGLAAQLLGMLEADIVIGIPLSARGKNIYFDRKWPK